ncbi:hypothetical protein ACGFIK_27105 [Micromonospora sp. NPDC048871]|uniref:hypothetical protein n=1 Tax=Micromonospora sp. NPDC048871 TaxID=3364259 RepID=UPI0037206EFF
MLAVLSGALDSAEKQGLIVRNVAKLVERPTHRPKALKTWTAEQAMAFLVYVAEDRLYAAWCLSLYGLRRGEVVGLRWEWVDLTGERAEELGVAKGTPTITIYKARVSVAGEVFEEDPKSERGRRTLPLDATLVAALKALKVRQAAERLEAGARTRSQVLLSATSWVGRHARSGTATGSSGWRRKLGCLSSACTTRGTPAER